MAPPSEGFDPRGYWEDRHGRTEGLQGVGYLGLNALNAWMYRIRAHVFRRVLEPYRRAIAGARVLDVGAGTGFFLREWLRLGAGEVVGVDIADVACERLRRELPGVDVRRLDIATAPRAEVEALGEFDFVSAIDVMFHVVEDDDYARAFENVARVLRPSGRFVFTENFLQRRDRSVSAWQVSRTLDEIGLALERAGLALERRAPLFVLMNSPIDSDRASLRRYWSLVSRLSRRSRLASALIGASLYPLERVLVSLARESPTSEIAIARPRSTPLR